MTRRLPLFLNLGEAKRPTIDAVRARLGGRASTGPGAGELVRVSAAGGFEHTGIVLYTGSDEIDVWTDDGVVRRAKRHAVRPAAGPTPEELAQVAADAAIFGGLAEGQRVRYRHDAGAGEGTLVEKCKFGALVERDDRIVVGVSFRLLWPAETN